MVNVHIVRHVTLGQLNRFQNGCHLLRTITHFDHVAFLHAIGRDVHFLAVHTHVAVVDELTGCKHGRHKFGAVDNSVKAAFQQTNQVFTGVAFDTLGFTIDAAELFFGQVAVVAFQLLLGAQLQTEIRQFALTTLAVLAGAVFATVYRRFRATPDVFAHAAINFVLGRRAFGHGWSPS